MNNRDPHAAPWFTAETGAITSFQGTGLSNFTGGVEIEFQAAKTLDPGMRKAILAARSPAEAKRIGRRAQLRPDWEQVKLEVMTEAVARKFAPGSRYARELLATGDRQLIEGNSWGDQFWGAVREGDGWRGHNHLGTILMARRTWLRAEEGRV